MNKETDLPVLFIRLSNGDDIISEVIEQTDIAYSLKHPMRILIDADLEAGKQTIYMTSWLPQGVMDVSSSLLKTKDVLVTGQLEADIEEYYRAMVYDIFIDKPLPKLKGKKEYVDSDKKVVTFKNTKSIKEPIE